MNYNIPRTGGVEPNHISTVFYTLQYSPHGRG